MMFDLNKPCFLITCPASATLSELKGELKNEDLCFGYHPLLATDMTLEDLFFKCPPNLYHFKYGPLPELVAGLSAELDNGDSFETGSSPSHLLCPDLGGFILGLPQKIAKVLSVTLKICPIPEKTQALLLKPDSKILSQKFITNLIANRFEPLFWRICNSPVKFSHTMATATKRGKNTSRLLICLTGIHDIIDSQLSHIMDLARSKNIACETLDMAASAPFLREHVFSPENHEEITGQYASLIWPDILSEQTKKPWRQIVLEHFDRAG